MEVALSTDNVGYQSARVHNDAPPGQLNASYRPTGPAYRSIPGELDHWLTERYCLYAAAKRDRVIYGEIHHPQWQLQPAEVELRANTMTNQIGIVLPYSRPLCHFARLQEVVAWPIVALKD